MNCPRCKKSEIRTPSGPAVLGVGLVMWLGAVGLMQSSMELPLPLRGFLGLTSAFGMIITLMGGYELVAGKSKCKACKHTWK